MKRDYEKPELEVLGELRDMTAASHGGFLSDLIGGLLGSDDPFDGSS